MQAFREKTRLCGSFSMPGYLLYPASEDEPEEVKNELLRNEASLNCVSLRSLVYSVGRIGLSRVEMNALRAPLTALSVLERPVSFFLLDTADAFIDGRLWRLFSN
jgi:hypothetical protein